MTIAWTAGIILVALELAPGEPCDITTILKTPQDRQALLDLDPHGATKDLTEYLCSRIGYGRIEHWSKHIAREQLDTAEHILIAGCQNYPAELAATWDAPPLLFIRGRLSDRPSVAIVGSRDTDGQTLDQTRSISRHLAAAGYSVVSGLAAGVDTAAHEGALDAGGHTIAVMGTGIDHVFPTENATLAERIAVTGAVISQFAPDAPRTGTTFLRRNTVIASLSKVSLVMAGTAKSGSRHEIEQAISHGRRVLMWRPNLGSEAWALELERQGSAEFVASSKEILSKVETHS